MLTANGEVLVCKRASQARLMRALVPRSRGNPAKARSIGCTGVRPQTPASRHDGAYRCDLIKADTGLSK